MTHQTQAGYLAGLATIIASLTLTDWAMVAGIVSVIITTLFQYRRDRRERLAFEIQHGLRSDRRAAPANSEE